MYTAAALVAFVAFFCCYRIVRSLSQLQKSKIFVCSEVYEGMPGHPCLHDRATSYVSAPQQATEAVKQAGKAVIMKSASKLCIKSIIM